MTESAAVTDVEENELKLGIVYVGDTEHQFPHGVLVKDVCGKFGQGYLLDRNENSNNRKFFENDQLEGGRCYDFLPLFEPVVQFSNRLLQLNVVPIGFSPRLREIFNNVYKGFDFSMMNLKQLIHIQNSTNKLISSATRRSLTTEYGYIFDGVIYSYKVQYAFLNTTPFVLKRDSASDVREEFEWSQKLDSPFLIKCIKIIPGIEGDKLGPVLVLPVYARSVHDLVKACVKEPEKDAVGYPGIQLQTAADVFLTVIYAIKYLNSQMICHCDIKPANIFINNNGKMVLADYGAMTQYGDEIMEATIQFAMFDVEKKPLDDYAKKAGLAMDLVCLATTLLALITHNNARRLMELEERLQVYEKTRNCFISKLALLCLPKYVSQLRKEAKKPSEVEEDKFVIQKIIEEGKKLIAENKLHIDVTIFN